MGGLLIVAAWMGIAHPRARAPSRLDGGPRAGRLRVDAPPQRCSAGTRPCLGHDPRGACWDESRPSRSRSSSSSSVVLLVMGLWVLPEVLRRLAVDRLSKQTGRAVTIQDVDLNLFTGRLAIKGFRLAERDRAEPFASSSGSTSSSVSWTSCARMSASREITLVAPSVRVGPSGVRRAQLLRPPRRRPRAGPQPRPGPSRWTVSIERARVAARAGAHRGPRRRAAGRVGWSQGLELDARSLTTRAGDAPGLVDVGAQINEARLAVHAEPVRLDPLRIAARVTLEGFETRRLNEYIYIPRGTPYMPRGGGSGSI